MLDTVDMEIRSVQNIIVPTYIEILEEGNSKDKDTHLFIAKFPDFIPYADLACSRFSPCSGTVPARGYRQQSYPRPSLPFNVPNPYRCLGFQRRHFSDSRESFRSRFGYLRIILYEILERYKRQNPINEDVMAIGSYVYIRNCLYVP